MNFDLPIPYEDWEEPFYSFIDVDRNKVFLALDENAFMWADVADA